jgi:hypothetical protein
MSDRLTAEMAGEQGLLRVFITFSFISSAFASAPSIRWEHTETETLGRAFQTSDRA